MASGRWSKVADIGQPDPGKIALRVFMVLLLIFILGFFQVALQDQDLRSTLYALFGI